MERPALNDIDDDRCDLLRWKGLFIETSSEPQSGDRLFWCHKTQQPIGPDGKPVDEYECNETRACYRPL